MLGNGDIFAAVRRARDDGADGLRRRRRRPRLPGPAVAVRGAGGRLRRAGRPPDPAGPAGGGRRHPAARRAALRGDGRPTAASATCASTSPGTSRATRSGRSRGAGWPWCRAWTSWTTCWPASIWTSRSLRRRGAARAAGLAAAAGRAAPRLAGRPGSRSWSRREPSSMTAAADRRPAGRSAERARRRLRAARRRSPSAPPSRLSPRSRRARRRPRPTPVDRSRRRRHPPRRHPVPSRGRAAIRAVLDALNATAGGPVERQQTVLRGAVDPGLLDQLDRCPAATSTLRFEPVYAALRPDPDWQGASGTAGRHGVRAASADQDLHRRPGHRHRPRHHLPGRPGRPGAAGTRVRQLTGASAGAADNPSCR